MERGIGGLMGGDQRLEFVRGVFTFSKRRFKDRRNGGGRKKCKAGDSCHASYPCRLMSAGHHSTGAQLSAVKAFPPPRLLLLPIAGRFSP